MNIKEILTKSGFKKEADDKFVKTLANEFVVVAYVTRNDGVIFHLNNAKEETLKMTIQTVELDDVVEALKELMNEVNAIYNSLNDTLNTILSNK